MSDSEDDLRLLQISDICSHKCTVFKTYKPNKTLGPHFDRTLQPIMLRIWEGPGFESRP